VRGHFGAKVIGQPRGDERENAAWSKEVNQVVEVKIVGAEVVVGIDAEHSVEELSSEGKLPSIRVDGEHAIRDAGVDNPP
jgi:hypothetical protein